MAGGWWRRWPGVEEEGPGAAVLALVEALAGRGQEGSLPAQTSYKSLRQGSAFSYIANVPKWSELP